MHKHYNNLISLENLFLYWKQFRKGKTKRMDVLLYERYLEDNIFNLHEELKHRSYKHYNYTKFPINDPKPRIIHKASVKDRLVHHLVFNELYRIFASIFIFHSYSSIREKGTHLAVRNASIALRKVSKNYTQNTYVLKCDIRKFFSCIDHKILFDVIKNKIKDKNCLWLIKHIISSFSSEKDKGVPIGNITSQIFANIYLNKFDWYIKNQLKIKYYYRYADDFIIIHANKAYLENICKKIEIFLNNKLKLSLHPSKVNIRKFCQGIDFLGYIILPHYIKLRTKTKNRMFKKMQDKKKELDQEKIDNFTFEQSLQSYLGLLNHCNGYNIKNRLYNI